MRTRILSVGLFTMMSASVASASPITIPSGLASGSTYFLVFVTAGTHDAVSSNIADYDAFVSSEAFLDPTLAALGTTWKAIGSTATVAAVTHIGVTGPVFNLNGQEVATGSPDLFDGTIDALIEYNQYGSAQPSTVWTGSTQYGSMEGGSTLGTVAPIYGIDTYSYYGWISVTTQNSDVGKSLYGISGPLEVPTTVPEPSTISLMLGPLLLLRGTHRRWRHRLATPRIAGPKRKAVTRA